MLRKVRNAFLVATGAIMVVFIQTIILVATHGADAQQSCPAGSYSIGDGICKAEPTGCPYGDSIPLDSPKCAPPPEQTGTAEKQQAIQEHSEPFVEQNACGK